MLYQITLCVLILNTVIVAWALWPTECEVSRTAQRGRQGPSVAWLAQ
jgi:hypothetical protein